MTRHLAACLVMAAACIADSALAAMGAEAYNVIWDSPSKDCNGSMPLGNGDISLNAWIEPSGDLCFYIGKTDSWDDNARLAKVGKVRVTLDPAPPTAPFKQELALEQGTMVVRYGDGTVLRLWADANHPVIQVDVVGPNPTTATAAIELWRTQPTPVAKVECSDVVTNAPPLEQVPFVTEPDIVIKELAGQIGWYHRNIKSVGPAAHARIQGMTQYPREDPLLGRTFGAVIAAAGPVKRLNDMHLQSAVATAHQFAIYVLAKHPTAAADWLKAVNVLTVTTAATPFSQRRTAHEKWWGEFWNRSWIRATKCAPVAGAAPAPLNDHPLKIGVAQNGGEKFAGEIRHVVTPADFTGPFTLAAEVCLKPGACGRIFDQITVGGSDGFLLDMLPGNTLRLIVGGALYPVKDALPIGQWATVVVNATAEKWTVAVNGKTVITTTGQAADDAAYLSQMFALQRFITVCAGRGAYPIKFNGSLFTVPYAGDPDGRRWGPGYWWQNTRLPYLSACANGDFEVLEPLFRMYVDQNLPLNKYRTKKYFGFDNAAYFIECIHFWGDVFNESYGWTPVAQRKDPLQESGWHKWEWVAGPELVWMMIEAYEHTGDAALLQKRIIPTAAAVIRFFDNYYKTNAGGQLVMSPSMACETWWECTNPMPELAGLRAITAKLLALPADQLSADQRAAWKTFAAKLAPLPVRDTTDGQALAPAGKFAGKKNCENPELYAVFPFRLCSFEKANRGLGVNALKHRWDRGFFGWRQDDIVMAYLGLTDETSKGVISRARNHDPDSRFPAFWGPNYDWVPDQDHGGVLMKVTQSMLMQVDGDKIFLFPAWPKDWDVCFKLHAPKNTTVECELRNGKLVKLEVRPPARTTDIVLPAGLAAVP